LSEIVALSFSGTNRLILILKFDYSTQLLGVSSNSFIWEEAKRHGSSFLQEKDGNLEKLFRELKENRQYLTWFPDAFPQKYKLAQTRATKTKTNCITTAFEMTL